MNPLEIPAAARRILIPIARRAAELRLPVFVVGGPVRDWLLGRSTYDLDIVAEGDPTLLAQFAAQMLRGRVEAFGQFGTLRVLSSNRLRVDFATCRKERYPTSACLPVVSRPAKIAEDLVRRDFTINAMAAELSPTGLGEIIDPFAGLRDLQCGLIRVLHDRSFRDDPTRVFRAARYCCRLSFKPAPGLSELARKALPAGRLLSRARLSHELLRILSEEDPACPLSLLSRWGHASLVFPGLKPPQPSLESVEERLAGMALALGPETGERFLAGIELEHRLKAAAHEALKVAKAQASPRTQLSAAARRALSAAHPRLPRVALDPLRLDGGDLEAAGLKPGPRFRELLDAAARLQWKGRLRTGAQAQAWLKRQL